MKTNSDLSKYETAFAPDEYTEAAKNKLGPFFSNLDKSVYAPLVFSPEVIGALCSRTSRAADDLRKIFLDEYIVPFLEPERGEKEDEEQWREKQKYGRELQEFINFLQQHPITDIFSNPRARSFYSKWLAQYGDDSIAQMAGVHLVYSSLSMVAIKHFEDQRIGLAPIEKSTRYVDYSSKINGQYRYYTDPLLAEMGLEAAYRQAMDGLFEAYVALSMPLREWLTHKYPEEEARVIQAKVFDTLRGLLPASTLSQVAFFGNGQAFEYMVSKSLKNGLGEIRWAAQRGYEELFKVVPSFLRRVNPGTDEGIKKAIDYQKYLAGRGKRMAPLVDKIFPVRSEASPLGAQVELIEYDPEGENKVIAGMIYGAPNNHYSWKEVLEKVKALDIIEKQEVLDTYFAGRTQRWQKVGRALENAYVRYEITMNIGAWRDLHRHRMLTQQRQLFSCRHGYDMPPEIAEADLVEPYQKAMDRAADVYEKIARVNPEVAQYTVPMAYRVRFMQWENLRESFWELELRTIPEGHPDYRHIEQQKFILLQKVYPLITKLMRVNMGEYDFARRGQEEKIQSKLKDLERQQV
ncbi:MAG: FAD-dependent thymidylate synthase [Candidatus Binatia bacterium]|nr:FAD-dependent thymidylate synthase [Candidatus Binatia bacterium]